MDYWMGSDFQKEGEELWHQYHDKRRVKVVDRSHFVFNQQEHYKSMKLSGKVLLMTFEERAAMSDFVTQSLCAMSEEMLIKVARKMNRDWMLAKSLPYSQYIANFSYVISKLQPGDLKDNCMMSYRLLIKK